MSKRILIVEDQEDLRGVLRDLLSGSGYTVVEAADGQGSCTGWLSASGVRRAKRSAASESDRGVARNGAFRRNRSKGLW